MAGPTEGFELKPQIRTLLIAHGIVMTTWMLLFVLQSLLIMAGKRRVHMTFGVASAVISACAVVLGFWVALAATRQNLPGVMIAGLLPRPFMIVPIFMVVSFATFITAGLWNRMRSEIHRPMMLLSALSTTGAPITRIHFIDSRLNGTIAEARFNEFFGMLVLGAFLVAVKWLVARRFDRWFVFGYGALLVACGIVVRLAITPAWAQISKFLVP